MTPYDPNLLGHLRYELGDAAEATLAEAYAKAQRLAEEWQVGIEGWLPGGTCSLILTGSRSGEAVVLRLPLLPWERQVNLSVLEALSGHGGVPMLESDLESGAALLPRLQPGTNLAQSEGTEDEAIEIFIGLASRLRQAPGRVPQDDPYRSLAARSFPASLRTGLGQDAQGLADWLKATSPPPQLLHGDLHHSNILRHGDEWFAIDPEGVSGDPAYEPAAFLRNSVDTLRHHPDLVGLTRHRIHHLAEGLGYPAVRIWGWALVRTLLSVSDEPGSMGEVWTKVAVALDALGHEWMEGWPKPPFLPDPPEFPLR